MHLLLVFISKTVIGYPKCLLKKNQTRFPTMELKKAQPNTRCGVWLRCL